MNDKINILKTEVLSDSHYILKKVTYEYLDSNEEWQTQSHEVFERGNGAAILLYNPAKKTVILTKQFRLPSFINGNSNGMLVEVCAGLLDDESPEDGIKRETEEETGYKIKEVRRVFKAYTSPGAVTEILYFFIAEYTDDMKVSEGGGLAHEHENIEVIEKPINDAMKMIEEGEIMDAKTIMLLQYVKLH
ncbi:MAG: NUDIX domain-containing protein, partial [Bacteroidota bacterium]|nr:NUDIX domain-containing protein [Bacteroidota bacterium]